jgi:hypothetical protein
MLRMGQGCSADIGTDTTEAARAAWSDSGDSVALSYRNSGP